MSDPRPPRYEAATETIPVARERLKVEKHEIERAAATIRLRTREEDVPVQETLRRDLVDIERLPVDLIVDAPPMTREEGDITIIPIVEEVLVRRFHVIEELRVRRRSETIEVDEIVTLRRQDVHIEMADGNNETSDPASPDD